MVKKGQEVVTEGMMFVLQLCVRSNAGNRRIEDEGAFRIAEGLERNTSLKKLYLQGVFIPCYSFYIFQLSGVWYEWLTMHLTFMSLKWNVWMIECGIGAIGAKRIGEMLEKNTSLKTLKLGSEIPFTSHSFIHVGLMWFLLHLFTNKG
jgi:hypothetical protein